MKRSIPTLARWLVIGTLIALPFGGCVPWQELASPTPPAVSPEWRALIEDLRGFSRKIGFRKTENFTALSRDRESFPFCGQASSFALPYSYEDPAIRWLESVMSEVQCHGQEANIDAYYGSVEAMGEIGTPVTPSMLQSTLDRFVYLVIHEDCHDQFDLPYGIEEALCNLITYHAMASFSREKYSWYSREHRSIRNYAGNQAKHTRATTQHYQALENLYARYGRAELSAQMLLEQRATVFAAAESSLALERGTINNVVLASFMTYSRHYPFLDRVFASLGGDLPRVVEFFRQVDQMKPTREEVMLRQGIADGKSVAMVRAYETAIIETIARALAQFEAIPR